jgi:Fe(3+) dicitrate transport protein
MMVTKKFASILFIFSFFSFGFNQTEVKVSGTILDSSTHQPIPFIVIEITNLNQYYKTDLLGHFETEPIPYGNHTIKITEYGYQPFIKLIHVCEDTSSFTIEVSKTSTLLDGVTVYNDDGYGTIRKMRSIEGVLISQGKKTVVIQIDKINGNKAASLGRQVYSRIPGLNIWESDGAGIQLGIGGRGLSPTRTSNYNTRQNGYDISADALGYPESYYTPPTEALQEIQLIRGAASLQFGTQFGGLLNFVLKKGPKNKKFEVTARHTGGSFGLNSSFISFGGSTPTFNYYAYYQHKFGNDWRPNSAFKVHICGIYLNK